MVLIAHPSGRRTFTAHYRHAGRARWLSLGDASIGVASARKLAARVLYQVAEGRDPAAERKADSAADTFAELHRIYLETYAKKHNRSWKQTLALMEAHVLPHVGRMKAAAVSRGDVKLILARLSDRPACHNQALASLSAVFTWAITEEVGNITSNPCARIRRQVLPSRSRVLSDSEIVLLWEGLDVAWRLVLLTGQRPGEVLAMRAEDVRDGSWHLPGRPVANWPGTKNSCDHCIPLSDTAAALVDDHVANRRGRRGCEARLRQLWQRLGVDKIRPHDLRRSFGTMVCRFGFGRPAMDRLLNHSDRRVASIYDRYSYEAEDRRIVDAVARHVERVIAGVESNNIVRLR